MWQSFWYRNALSLLIPPNTSLPNMDKEGRKHNLYSSRWIKPGEGLSGKQILKTIRIRNRITAEKVSIPAFFPEESSMPVLMTAADMQHFSLQRAQLDLHSSLYSPCIANGFFPPCAHWRGSLQKAQCLWPDDKNMYRSTWPAGPFSIFVNS